MNAEEFETILVTALLADYFNIAELISPDGPDVLIVPGPLAHQYKAITDAHGIPCQIGANASGEWVRFAFPSNVEKEQLSDYFQQVNHSFRIQGGLVQMPEIYDAQGSEPDPEICSAYLTQVVQFFENDRQGKIRIPITVDDGIQRAYAAYTAQGHMVVER